MAHEKLRSRLAVTIREDIWVGERILTGHVPTPGHSPPPACSSLRRDTPVAVSRSFPFPVSRVC